jgi:hypothetical protein
MWQRQVNTCFTKRQQTRKDRFEKSQSGYTENTEMSMIMMM